MYKVTKDFKTKQPIKFRFWDTMGLEGKDGLQVDDVIEMLDGNIADKTDLSKRVYSPSSDTSAKGEKINCVAFLVDATNFALMDPGIVQKWIKIRQAATDRDMNPIVVVTHIDGICKDTATKLEKVFQSRAVHEKVKEVSFKLGPQENMVCPVMNYTSQTETEKEIDILTLLVLRQILRNCEQKF